MPRRLESPLSAEPPAISAGIFDARFRRPLMRFFQRRVMTAAEAEDLTQEVFVRLLRRSEALQPATAEAYVFQVATNLLRDRSRRHRSHLADRHLSFDGEDAEVQTCRSSDLAADHVLEKQEELNAAITALNELDGKCRDIFLLYRVERLKQKDIASLYGLSVRMVEKYIVKAAAHLARRCDRT